MISLTAGKSPLLLGLYLTKPYLGGETNLIGRLEKSPEFMIQISARTNEQLHMRIVPNPTA